MKTSTLLKLLKIEVDSFSYGIKKRRGLKKNTIFDAEWVNFDFHPLTNKKDPNKKKIIFQIFSNEESKNLDFNLSVSIEYKVVDKNEPKEEHNKRIATVLLPQAISFSRGYLYAATQNLASIITLPFIDVLKSLEEKFGDQSKTGDN